MKLQNKTILIISNEPWGDMWYSKQHYANELSKMGYNVFFVNPVSNWRLKNLISFKIRKKLINNHLIILSYYNNFPLTILPKLFTKINDFINERKIIKNLDKKDLVWWKFDPFRFVKKMKGINIYHVVDPYMHLWQDKYQSNNSDIVLCTSPKYIDYYLNKKNKTLFIPHGVSNDEMQIDNIKVQEIKQKYGLFSLFIGTISEDTDMSLIEALLNNGVKILILGSELSNNVTWLYLKKHKNLIYIGVVKAQELKNYIRASQVCLNFYKFNLKKDIGSGSPLKILNYVSQYKPVVTSIDSEIDDLKDKIIYRAYNIKEYISFVKEGLNDELFVDVDAVKNYIDTHLYQKLIEKIENFIE